MKFRQRTQKLVLTDGWTDRQGESYIPPRPNFVCGGIKIVASARLCLKVTYVFSIHVMAAILVVDVVIGCKFEKGTCENCSWQSTGLIFSGRTWGCEVEEFTWHSRFKKCLLLSYSKHCASTAPSILIIQSKPHSKGQNYFHRLFLCNYTEQEYNFNKQTVFTKTDDHG